MMRGVISFAVLLCSAHSAAMSEYRRLEVGDFAELNQILSGALINLGDVSVAEGIIVNLSLRNLKCTNVAVGDMSIGAYRRSDQTVALVTDVVGLSMDCLMDYDYMTAFFVSGSGRSSVQFSSTASATALMESADFNQYPPTSSFIESCAAVVDLYNLQFLDGGILAIAPVESLIAKIVESQAERTICQQLGELSTTALVQLLGNAKSTLDGYPADLDVDPLQREADLVASESRELLNLQDRDTDVGVLFDFALHEFVEFLSRNTSDDAGTPDMQANIMLRDVLLVDRALLLNVSDFAFVQDGILWKKVDKLTDTTIYLNSVKLLGLDTLTTFLPFETIGNHTVRNEISWEYLMFELNATIDIKPSQAPDTLIVDPGSTNVVEQITIKLGFDNAAAAVSVLFGVDQSQLETIQLGSLLNWDSLVSCLMSTLLKTELSELTMSFGNIQEPTLEGFVSPGVDRVVTDSVLSAFQMYEAAILLSAPAFFQIAVRAAINTVIENELRNLLGNGESCRIVDGESSNDFVDFRDLFLVPETAVAVGGLGTEPYGNIMSSLHTGIVNRLMTVGDDGLPQMNALIRSSTKMNTGVEGMLNFTEPFAFALQNPTIFESLVSRLEIKSESISVSNLDSIAQPLQVLDVAGAHRIGNSIRLGQVTGRPVSVSSNLLFQIEGDNSPLAVSNLFELKISFASHIDTVVLATLNSKKFLEFPLRDLANPWCWLATLPAPEYDREGNMLNESPHRGLRLDRFGVTITDFDLNPSCISCTSLGGESMPEIVVALRDSGAISLVQEHLQTLLNDVTRGYWKSLQVDNLIALSRKTCPHSSEYDSNADSSLVFPGIPDLSSDAMESMILFSALAVNFGMVVNAKSHLLRPTELTEPLSGEELMEPLKGGELIDWRDLGNSVGKWATSILDDTRTYVGGQVEDEVSGEFDLQANILVRDILGNGTFSMGLDNMSFGGAGMKGNLTEFRIFGLDSMLEADILDVLGPSTLGNRLKFKGLRLELEVSFDIENSTETVIFSVGVNDVAVNGALLLAVDQRKLGTMRVGSALHLKQVLPCMVSKFHATNLTRLLVSVESIEEPQVIGFLSKNASVALGQTSRLFLDHFSADLVTSIPKVFDITIRQVLNRILFEMYSDENSFCSYDDAVSTSGTIDFRDLFLTEQNATALGGNGGSPYGDTSRIMYQSLQNQFCTERAEQQMFANDLIRPITFEQSGINGTLDFPGELFNASGDMTLSNWVVSVEGRFSNVRIENLDSIGQPLSLLQPVWGQASVLNNSISVGVGDKPLRLRGSLFVALSDGNELNLRNEIDVVLEVHALELVVTALLAMSESSFFSLSLEHLNDINCWLSTIPLDSLDPNGSFSDSFQYRVSAEKAKLNISCVSCDNPLFGDLVGLLYKPGETKEEVQVFLDATRDMIDSFIGSNFLQSLIRMVVSDAVKLCPASPTYDANATSGKFWFQPETYVGTEAVSRDKKMVYFNIANVIVAVVLLAAAAYGFFVIRRKNRQWFESLSQDEVDLVKRQDFLAAAKEEYIDANTGSMFESEQIPRSVRYAVPLVLLFNIVMYLVAHIALLCYINLEGQIAGEQFTVEHFLDFRFFGAATTTYNNGGNEMAIFLIILSGIWPYVKLLGALWMWFCKPNCLSVSRRGKLFLWMDALTKLSIIDIITMLIAVAALLVYVGGPGEEMYNSEDLYALTLVVIPQVGFYSILIAQRLNRISSRFFLDYHNKIVSAASEEFRRLRRLTISTDHTHCAAVVPFDTAEMTESPSSVSNATFVTRDEKRFESSIGSRNSSPSLLVDGSITFDEENSASSLHSPSLMHARSDAGDFLVYDPHDNFNIESFRDRVARSGPPLIWQEWTRWLSDQLQCTCLQGRRRILGGSVSAGFAVIFVIILFIIGCALAPSLSMDAKGVLSMALESGRTYADAVNDFNMFYTVSLVLLKSRFVLDSTADYIGLGILLVLAGSTIVAFPLAQGWKALQEFRMKRKSGSTTSKPKSVIPGFTNRLKVWNHMEIFIISFCIASWQLGAVVSYLIHNYCASLQRLYEGLSYAGLVEQSTANCFRVQVSDPFTLALLFGSFTFLLVSFILQAHSQFQTNRRSIEELEEECY